jgi:catechol 2,3-dioxygenase-like lactoylglutathione lyase family enzyme
MTVELNHTIVRSRDKGASARFLAEVLGLPAPRPFGPFLTVEVDNDVTLDFVDADEAEIPSQHYAFLVSEDAFDRSFERLRARGVPFWADPSGARPGEVNTRDGGRGLYFEDPSGHWLELLTRPYGSG